MTKEKLVYQMVDHFMRGEDALWIAEHYQMSAVADKELDTICQTLRQQADALWERLAQLDKELELNTNVSW